MSDPTREHGIQELENKIRLKQKTIARYEVAIKRWNDTPGAKVQSFLEGRLQLNTKLLRDRKDRYKKLVGKNLTEVKPVLSGPPATLIQISDLMLILSTEEKAREDFMAFQKSDIGSQLEPEISCMKNELSQKERAADGFGGSPLPAELDFDLFALKAAIKLSKGKLSRNNAEGQRLMDEAFKALIEANNAASRDLEIPGGGRRTRLPNTEANAVIGNVSNTSQKPAAQSKITTANPTASTTLQLKPTALLEDPATKTLLKGPSKLAIDPTQARYKNIVLVSTDEFAIGDIGWTPLLRLSAPPSESDIRTPYGPVCAKVFPFIVVKKLEDCMLGLVINTAGVNGLERKPESVRQRSTYVTGSRFKGSHHPPYGGILNPLSLLKVDSTAGYDPADGAFVDMFETHRIPYDSRFKKDGRLTAESRVALKRMRISALMYGAMDG